MSYHVSADHLLTCVSHEPKSAYFAPKSRSAAWLLSCLSWTFITRQLKLETSLSSNSTISTTFTQGNRTRVLHYSGIGRSNLRRSTYHTGPCTHGVTSSQPTLSQPHHHFCYPRLIFHRTYSFCHSTPGPLPISPRTSWRTCSGNPKGNARTRFNSCMVSIIILLLSNHSRNSIMRPLTSGARVNGSITILLQVCIWMLTTAI